MNAACAAARWADTWSQAWPRRDAEAIAALYSDTVVYRSPAFREPDLGLAGVRRYLSVKSLQRSGTFSAGLDPRSRQATEPRSSGGQAGPSTGSSSRSQE